MSIDLMVNALVTGAGASATATTAVTDAYAGVKQGVRRLFHRAAEAGVVEGDPNAAVDEFIATVEADPVASRDAVAERLTRLLTTADVGAEPAWTWPKLSRSLTSAKACQSDSSRSQLCHQIGLRLPTETDGSGRAKEICGHL